MPFCTDRAELLDDLKRLFTVNVLLDSNDSLGGCSSTSSSSSDDDDFSSSGSESDDECLKGSGLTSELHELYMLADSIRYHEDRMKHLKSKDFAYNFFTTMPRSYFRHVTRMEKSTFWTLVGLIENNPIFYNRSAYAQMAVPLQLAATLDRLGHHGNGAALKHSGILWGISIGTIVKCMHRCMTALEAALANAVVWPDADERARIAASFAQFGFDGCIGLVDSTTLPLSQRPKIDGETYFDRKKRYSINMQVICDDKLRFIHAYAGMPGSVHDLTVLKHSPFWEYRSDPRTFSPGQYLLADSAYGGLPNIVASYKYTIASRDRDKEEFNFCLAKTRVGNEHCIGILKSRWHSLKEQKTQLKGSYTSDWVIRQVECCVRLHNFVIDCKDEWTDSDVESDKEDDVGQEDEIINDSDLRDASGLQLRARVMTAALEFNRRPGGILA